MDVTEDLVRRTASLARLALSDAEVARAVKDLARILHHVESLADAGVEVSASPAGAAGAVPSASLRPDVAQPCVRRADALANAPAHDEVFFLVPKVLDGD